MKKTKTGGFAIVLGGDVINKPYLGAEALIIYSLSEGLTPSGPPQYRHLHALNSWKLCDDTILLLSDVEALVSRCCRKVQMRPEF